MPNSLALKNFKDLKQVFKIVRTRENKKTGKITTETVYGGHTQSSKEKSAKQILDENRSHWAIETSEHYVRDVSFDEDKSKIRTGNGPHMMAILRNIALNLMRSRGVKNVREKIKIFAGSVEKLLAFLAITTKNLKFPKTA